MQYGNIDKNYMAHREFSFTLEDDIYLRYLSFSNQEEFETEMIKKCPHKIDIGAVYNARPSDHKKLTKYLQDCEKTLNTRSALDQHVRKFHKQSVTLDQ